MRLIDADALKNHFAEHVDGSDIRDEKINMFLCAAVKVIDAAPTIQPEKTTEQAHWIDAQESGEYDTVYKCPECGAKRSVQAEDTATVLGCSCGFMGPLRSATVEVEPAFRINVWCEDGKYCRSQEFLTAPKTEGIHLYYTSPPNAAVPLDVAQDAEKYRALATPEINDFMLAVEREALYQRKRWGAENDAGKADTDWFWLIGYLAGKAINKPEKLLHHIITTAAACLNWHSARSGNYTKMRAGIEPPDNDAAAKAADSTGNF